jgi:hypothetical protein
LIALDLWPSVLPISFQEHVKKWQSADARRKAAASTSRNSARAISSAGACEDRPGSDGQRSRRARPLAGGEGCGNAVQEKADRPKVQPQPNSDLIYSPIYRAIVRPPRTWDDHNDVPEADRSHTIEVIVDKERAEPTGIEEQAVACGVVCSRAVR